MQGLVDDDLFDIVLSEADEPVEQINTQSTNSNNIEVSLDLK